MRLKQQDGGSVSAYMITIRPREVHMSLFPYTSRRHRGYFRPKHKDIKTFENHLNPVMFVFIR